MLTFNGKCDVSSVARRYIIRCATLVAARRESGYVEQFEVAARLRHQLKRLLVLIVNVPGDVRLGRAAGEARKLNIVALLYRFLCVQAADVVADSWWNFKKVIQVLNLFLSFSFSFSSLS